MIQFKETIREESKTICEQLSSDDKKSELDFGTIKPIKKTTVAIRAILSILTALTIFFIFTIDYKNVDVLKGFADKFDNFMMMFLHPYSHRFNLWDAFHEIVATFGLALLTTLISGIISFCLGLLASQNLASKQVSNIIKGLVAIIRPVPTIMWVFIFAVATELGSAVAVIGMTFHSIGYLTKPYSESFEDVDRSVIKALRASGVNWWQIVFQTIIPSSITQLISWTFLRFQINFAYAIPMSVAAGAGEIGLITYLVLAFAIVLEVGSMNNVR